MPSSPGPCFCTHSSGKPHTHIYAQLSFCFPSLVAFTLDWEIPTPLGLRFKGKDCRPFVRVVCLTPAESDLLWRPSCGPWAAAVWFKSSLSLRSNCCRYVAAKAREIGMRAAWVQMLFVSLGVQCSLMAAWICLMENCEFRLSFSYSESIKVLFWRDCFLLLNW